MGNSEETNGYLVGYNCGMAVEVETVDIHKTITSMQKEQQISISLGDLVIFAVAQSLPAFPEFNSYFSESLKAHLSINIAYSINLGKGPKKVVLQDTDKLSLPEISKAVKIFAFKYMRDELTARDGQKATISILNLSFFNPQLVITPLFAEQAALITIAAEHETVKVVDGRVIPKKVFNLCLAYDVRVADCQRALQFLNAVKKVLEEKEI